MSFRGNKTLDVSSSDEDEYQRNHLLKSTPSNRSISKLTGNEAGSKGTRVRKDPPSTDAQNKGRKKRSAPGLNGNRISTSSQETKSSTNERKVNLVVKKEEEPEQKGNVKTEFQTPVKQEVKKERVVYDMPGQTKQTPPEDDSLRKFYTSLLNERNDSKMAKRWCVQHGLLSKSEAESWCESNNKSTRSSSTRSKRERGSTSSIGSTYGRRRLSKKSRVKRIPVD